MGGRLRDQIVLITGAGSGLGEASAKRMASEGAKVIVADINAENGSRVANEIGSSAQFLQCDVANEIDIENAVNFAVEKFGRLDCMYNNAGFLGPLGSIDEFDADEYDAASAVLLRATFLGMKHAARVMKEQRSGIILTQASVAGVTPGLGPHVYSACKAAIIHLIKSVAIELSPWSIRVIGIAPGKIVTPESARFNGVDPNDEAAIARVFNSKTPLPGRFGVADDIAKAAVYLVSAEGAFVNGTTLIVDGGLTGGAKEGVVAP